MMDVKIRNVLQGDWRAAVELAERFLRDYPDRIGVRNGSVYTLGRTTSFHVYRTRTTIVIVGLERLEMVAL